RRKASSDVQGPRGHHTLLGLTPLREGTGGALLIGVMTKAKQKTARWRSGPEIQGHQCTTSRHRGGWLLPSLQSGLGRTVRRQSAPHAHTLPCPQPDQDQEGRNKHPELGR